MISHNIKKGSQFKLQSSFLIIALVASLACSSAPKFEQPTNDKLNKSSSQTSQQILEKKKAQLSLPAKKIGQSKSELSFVQPYQAVKTLEFPQYRLLPKYKSEQSLGVKYFTNQERQALKVSVKDGRFMNAENKPLDPELDEPKHVNRSGKAIFVISVDGSVWVCFDQRYGFIHHSSLLAGAPILAGGELVLEAGQLLTVSNASGHYQPPPQSIDVALKLFKAMGVDLSQTKRFEIGPSGLPVQKNSKLNLKLLSPKTKTTKSN